MTALSTLRLLVPILVVIVALSAPVASAQSRSIGVEVAGQVVDADEDFSIEGVNILAISTADSTQRTGLTTDREGRFVLRVRWSGNTSVRFSFVGYRAEERLVTVGNGNIDLGKIAMHYEPIELEGLEVAAVQDRITVSGDTLAFNADGFQVHQDATVDGLVEKLPGFSMTDGQLMYNGEPIGAIMLDGREFFGQEAMTALESLPAEIIKSVQVYDKLSEQAEFSGFDDGESVKAINLQTKEDKRNGQFGTANAGYGSEERYQSALRMNVFSGDRRVTINASSSNSDGGRGRGGWGRRGGGDGGINRTHSFHLNFSDTWADKVEIDTGYNLRANDSRNQNDLTRDYFLDDALSQRYQESNFADSRGMNHSFWGRIRYDINERNRFSISPRFSLNTSESERTLEGITTSGTLSDLSRLLTSSDAESDNMSGGLWMSWMHRFDKPGRTISFSANGSVSGSSSEEEQDAETIAFEKGTAEEFESYLKRNTGQSSSLGGRMSYTEPFGENRQIEIFYEPRISNSESDRITREMFEDGFTGDIDSTLSSQYDSEELTQEAGLSLRHNTEKLSIRGSLELENTRLLGTQSFPNPYEVDHSFTSVLPNARIEYEFSKTHQLRLDYRARSRTPSGSQLQSVLDNSNPLYLSTGNPSLRPSTSHSISLRDSWNGAETGKSFSIWSRAAITRNSISRTTFYARDEDREVDGVEIPEGGQLSRPVNLNGAWSLSMNATYTQPFDLVKSNLTLESGYSYSRDPGMVDEELNTTSVRRISGEFRLTSNISEKVDFRLSQSSTYNIVNNEIQTRQQSNYFRHRGGASFRVGPFKGVTVNSSFSLNRYNRLGSAQDTATEDWDAGISYQIPHLESVRIEWAMKDILNTGNNISHSENAQYIQSSATNVLGRHMLFLVRYELKEFRP